MIYPLLTGIFATLFVVSTLNLRYMLKEKERYKNDADEWMKKYSDLYSSIHFESENDFVD